MNLKAIAVASFMAVAAVPMASMAADKAGTTKTEAGQYASDAAVTAKVKAALLAEKNLKSLDINVETQNGVVQLSGFAVSSAQVDQAVDVATNVKGVKNVKNDIRLKTDTEG
ncbi:MAG TPA: BON domain-containing protein [Solimonas sp.]